MSNQAGVRNKPKKSISDDDDISDNALAYSPPDIRVAKNSLYFSVGFSFVDMLYGWK